MKQEFLVDAVIRGHADKARSLFFMPICIC